MSSSKFVVDIQLKIVSFSRKSTRFCGFLCFVKITFTWLIPASIMYEVGNGSKNGSVAARSLGYSVAVLILLQYSLK